MSLLNNNVKKKQYLVLGLVATGLVMVLMFVFKDQFFGKTPSSGEDLSLTEKGAKETKIQTVRDDLKPEEIWRYKMSEEGTKLKNQISELRQNLEENMTQESAVTSNIANLESKILHLESVINSKNNPSQRMMEGLQHISIRLQEKKQRVKIDTVETVIPAGSFAKAVLLSGVDASTSLASSSDPLPILVRITDHGTLPRKFKSDLKDCHIIVGGYGDISSERVYGRLEKLTCTHRETKEVIETDVAGFIAGEDGKVGLRGKVVAKESAYLANSFMGGLIGGLANTATPSINHTPYISQGVPQGPSIGDKFKTGFGEGASNSMDRLSKYYIDRAELLQPVIEISAGRIIDIVFTAKAEIGSSDTKAEVERKRNLTA